MALRRDGFVVVKLGGTTLAEQAHLFPEIAALAEVRPLVVVHGGGARVTGWSERLGIEARFHEGLRVTDEPAMDVVTAVLRGLVNTELVAALRKAGCDAVGLSGVDGGMLRGGRVPDRGRVVTIESVRPTLLDTLVRAGTTPVVAPLALDASGVVCNVNADDAAAGLARGLRADHLVLLTDVAGVRGPDGATLRRVSVTEAEELIADGTIGGGMIPKVRSALAALQGRTRGSVVIADGSAERAITRALQEEGFGTRFLPAHPARREASTSCRQGDATKGS